jgi:arginine N-succinyltransferase
MDEHLVSEFYIRDAAMADIDDIVKLGTLLNTVNLPAHTEELTGVISASERSFSLEQEQSDRAFLFVLVGPENRVIGTSQIFAKHGTLLSPHTFLQVGIDERYSPTLQKYFRHQTLRLKQSFDGPTEIGSLVLTPHFRTHPAKLGRPLSFVRFLFIAMNSQFFCEKILAELLPPLGPNFESAFWDAIGRPFTGMDYYEADFISRNNKEFIKSLFPSGDIYVSLLPKDAQEVIGQVGQNSMGAAHLLSSIGFQYNHHIDPFDGGPHYEAKQKDISLIKDALHGQSIGEKFRDVDSLMLVGRFRPELKSGQRFRAAVSKTSFDKASGSLSLAAASMSLLELSKGSPISAIKIR